MSKLLLTISILAFISVPANAVRNGTSVNRTSSEFANLVRITNGDNICSGTRITFDTVLTAAHCFGEDMSRSSFKAEYLNGDVTITEKIDVSAVVINHRDLDRELAVFKISPFYGNNDLFKETPIYKYKKNEFKPGDKFLFAGYGMDNSESTSQLKQGHLRFQKTSFKVETIRILDEAAMEARNKKHLEELAKKPKVDKAAQLPEVKLEDCDNSGLGWRARRSCRKQNNYLLFQRELELRAITHEIEQERIQLQNFLDAQIFKTKIVKGFDMLVLKPLRKKDIANGSSEVENQLPCPGDSGGPLYKVLSNGEHVLVAIISNITAPSKIVKQTETLPGHKVCAKATAAKYIPVALHADFLKQFSITF